RLGVRAIEHEQVREARHHHAEIGARTVDGFPGPMQVGPAFADELRRREVLYDVEAGRGDDDVDLAPLAVRGLDAVFGQADDAVGDQLDIVAGQRAVPAVIDHRAA